MENEIIGRVLTDCRAWIDFKAQLALLDNKQKGDAFEALTLLYLKLDPKYATKIRHVWPLGKVPAKVQKHLNLPDRDEGIDLIAVTDDWKYWAIQCKYRDDESHSLTRRELSTFTDLAFGICKNIDLALVCTSTERISHKLKLYEDRVSFCAADVWRSLDADFFKAVKKLLGGKEARPEPLKPRPHQVRAIKKAHAHFVTGKEKRGKLIMPCGTGKSLTAYWIAEKLNAKTILVAVPSLALIRQTLAVWARESFAKKRKIHWVCVCSDETVSSFERDDVAVLTHDLGVKIHTDPEEISEWLKMRHAGLTVVMTTYQSGKAIAEATRKAKRSFDLGIMDEAHKTVGRDNSLFSHLLSDKNISIRKRVFMTATERRYRGDSDQILSMDNLEVYGDTFELLSFKEAIECNPSILSDYKVVTIAVSKSEVADLIRENVFVRPDKGRWDNDVEAEMLASAIALRKAIKKYGIKHSVSFHGSIIRAKAFKDIQDRFGKSFPEFGQLETFHVSGSTPTAVRSRTIEEFESASRSLITNARCLTEGVDVPNIDCVLFADPRRSSIDIVQAVGRALRPHKGKRYGYVIVPILVDGKKSTEELWGEGAFKEVIATLRALAANDDRIIEYFRSISSGHKPRASESPISFEVPSGVVIDADLFVRNLELMCWGRLAKLSWRPFIDARNFARSLNFRTNAKWRDYSVGGNRPSDIPAKPDIVYRESGWIDWADWLGSGNSRRGWLAFKEAKSFVHRLKLQSVDEWRSYCNGGLAGIEPKPADIPRNPRGVYASSGWTGYGDWLGTGRVANFKIKYRPFKVARRFVRSLGLKSHTEWRQYCDGKLKGLQPKPSDIPTKPWQSYKGRGWTHIGDWLGSGTTPPQFRRYRSFQAARKFARSLNLKTVDDWYRYTRGEFPNKPKLPADIPISPHYIYRQKGWNGIGDWLGTGIIANQRRVWRNFDDARNFVRKLELKSFSEWQKYCSGGINTMNPKPIDIPANPQRTYLGKGWKGFGDWLGKCD